MYLSKLELIGFKSFAQKVELSFDTGITAIVGPNGCGKTNIVDAIRWVLGEQRSSTLRTDLLEEVIFNGTKNRKPLSMAEVSMTIENTEGILSTEYAEVTLTRRVYRSGESEYLLNRIPCRLKDILDLFMDTGMGPDAYSVIELKMVETILSDKTDERRRLFEEAAGVTKYKHRRKAAYRKLESVLQDLVRVNDIVKEVQKTVNSLERQAKRAEQYNEYSSSLRALEVDLLERDYARAMEKIGPLEDELRQAVEHKNQIDEELSSEETLLEVLRTESSEVEQKMSEAQKDLSAQGEKIHQIEQEIVLARERRKSLEVNISRYERERVELSDRKAGLERERVKLHQVIDGLKAKVEDVAREHEESKRDFEALDTSLNRKRKEAKAHHDALIALIQRIAEKRGEQDRIRSRIENISGRIERAHEDIKAYALEVERNEAQIAKLSVSDKGLRKTFVQAEMEFYQQETRKQELKTEVDGLQSRLLEVRAEIDRKNSRVEFLRGLVESYDGFSEGTKYLLTGVDWSDISHVTVGEALRTEDRFSTAIEAALGEVARYIVVSSMEDAYRGVELLRAHQKGQATFICLDRLPLTSNTAGILPTPGVHGWAVDLVQFDERYRGLFSYLFDRTLVVDDLQVANRIITKGGGLQCVTVDGEIVTSAGVLKGGSLNRDKVDVVGRRSQIEELKRELADLQKELTVLRETLERKVEEGNSIDLKVAREHVKSIEQKVTSVEMQIAQVEFEKRRAKETVERSEQEIETLEAERTSLQQAMESFVPDVEELQREKSGLEGVSSALARELSDLENVWSEKSRIVNDLRTQLVRLQGEKTNVQNQLEYAQTTIATLAESAKMRGDEIAQARVEIGRIRTEVEEGQEICGQLKSELTTARDGLKEIERELSRKRGEIHELESRIRDERSRHDQSLNMTFELEKKISELKLKAENLRQLARDEFEAELKLKTYPEDDLFSFSEAREQVRVLKGKLRSLGPINFEAFDHYKTEKERVDFLTAQRDDLNEAERTLLDTIEEINSTAQKKFMDTFAQIRENFIKTFKSLFDEGDECDLKLEEGVDPLEAAIEITAKPRGKRPTSIDLLSGGEKALTATALLFAIYLVKPSPFCILDEVDAPLDDSNIDRFTRILRKFCDNTQFIVVTHNKRTMESASRLYGVTMEEEGVSKIVSVRFREGAAVTTPA
ncbi:MAG: chromosome segregation protein SMC [Bacteroidota bacterium]